MRRSDQPPSQLLRGDLVLLPHGLDHELVHDPSGTSEPLEVFLAKRSVPASCGPATTVICGVYLSDAQLAHPMLRTLPPVVHFPASAVDAMPALAATLSLLTAELEQSAPGGEAVVQHLFDALFIYVIRAWAEGKSDDRPGWLSALKDRCLLKALTCMHSDPAAAWTVETLARESGLSRAAFARRFAEVIGEPPLAYLTRWRMGLAVRLLQNSDASIAQVAGHVGYESEFAFSRAFKRDRGIPPARFRREKRGCS
ncbi:MAG TPA: AraC family transcriptional regulator [Bryobacteraceae bacterium]|nr:AraC family transcriptional regulator [Bryobacteraceae bacterium]